MLSSVSMGHHRAWYVHSVLNIINLTLSQYTKAITLKGKFSSRIEGALASTLNHDFNWKQLLEMILYIFLLMFSKFI